jgi:hypothetical protein
MKKADEIETIKIYGPTWNEPSPLPLAALGGASLLRFRAANNCSSRGNEALIKI